MRTIIDLTETQLNGLKTLMERQSLSRAELIRRAVDAYLSRHLAEQDDEAFGLWSAASRAERSDRAGTSAGNGARDGSRYQTALRLQWANVRRDGQHKDAAGDPAPTRRATD